MRQLFLLPVASVVGILVTTYSAYITYIGNGSKWDVINFIFLFFITIFFILAYRQVKKS